MFEYSDYKKRELPVQAVPFFVYTCLLPSFPVIIRIFIPDHKPMRHLKTGKYLGQVQRTWNAGGILISEAAYPTRVFEGWHYHENHHISFIVQGGNREQRKGREAEVLPGEIISYRSGELHRNSNTHVQSRNINLEIENSFFAQYGLEEDAFDNVHLNQGDAKFAVLKIYRECLSGNSTAIHSLLLGLLDAKEPAPGNTPPWVITLREVLHGRWNENMTLRELALLLQVHPVTISKFFPRYFHCTLGEYTRKIRVEKAIGLVASGLPLTAIAHECGFYDQSHFIRAFKEMTGFLPGGYKKMAG